MTGHCRGDAFHGIFDFRSAVETFEILGERAQGDLAVLAGQQGGKRRHAQRVAAEFFHLESESLELGCVGGQRLATQAKFVTLAGTTDGPFTEAKEVIGGYWFIVADSLEEAARVAADNPCLACGLSYEIRPIEAERASAYRPSNETPLPAR